MITDPKTIPDGRRARRAYAVAIGVLAVLLIAPQETEFGTKVAILGALALVTAVRPLAARLLPRLGGERLGLAPGMAAFLTLTGAAGSAVAGEIPEVEVVASSAALQIDRPTALKIASDMVADLRSETEALARRSPERGADGASGARLAALWEPIREAGPAISVPEYDVERISLALEPGRGQGPPLVVATLKGSVVLATYAGSPLAVERRADPAPYEGTFELVLEDGRYLIARSRVSTLGDLNAPAPSGRSAALATGVRFEDVAPKVGLDFRQGAFHFRVSRDPIATGSFGSCTRAAATSPPKTHVRTSGSARRRTSPSCSSSCRTVARSGSPMLPPTGSSPWRPRDRANARPGRRHRDRDARLRLHGSRAFPRRCAGLPVSAPRGSSRSPAATSRRSRRRQSGTGTSGPQATGAS